MALVDPIAAPDRRNVEAVLIGVAVLMAVGAYGLVGLGTNGQLPAGMLGYGIGLGLLGGIVHLALRARARYADPVILPIAVAINGLGLVVIHRLDLAHGRPMGDSFAWRQLIWMAVGTLAASAVLFLLPDHRILSRYTYTAMFGGLVLLLLPLVPFLGKNINGARIWIGLGPMSFQPGEVAKILLTIFFAGYLVNARDSLSLVGRTVLGLKLPRARDMGPLIVSWVISLGVLVFEKDLGTSLLFFGLFVAMLYVATERLSWVLIGLGMFASGALLAWSLFSHVQLRVSIWLEPFGNEYAYQLMQGLYGMANGGLMGTGLGAGRPDITPYAESDFIIASVGEELGLTGVFALLLLYLLIVERGLRTAIGVRDGLGKMLATGLAFSFALQCFVVLGGVLRIIPLTGLTTPFLAYGGSSLVANWMIIALLLRISDSARRPAPEPLAAPVQPPAPEPVAAGSGKPARPGDPATPSAAVPAVAEPEGAE